MTHSRQHKYGNQLFENCLTDACAPIKSSSKLSCISIIHLPAISREDVLVAVVPVPVHNLACKTKEPCIVKISRSGQSGRKYSVKHHCTEPGWPEATALIRTA